jgi:hypothetical protein
MSLNDLLTRFWTDIAARPEGPMAFRFFVQPAVASFFAVRDGVRDARHQQPAYLWTVLFHPGQRGELLRHGWKSLRNVFIMAILIDLAYQVVEVRGFRPIQAVFVGVLLALVPYIILRGPTDRVASLIMKKADRPRRAA